MASSSLTQSIGSFLPPMWEAYCFFGEGGPVRFVTNQILCNKPLTFFFFSSKLLGRERARYFCKNRISVCVIRKRLLLCSPTDSLVFLFFCFVLLFFPSCSKPRDDEMNSCAPDVHVSMWLGHATGDAGGDHLLLVDFGRFFFLFYNGGVGLVRPPFLNLDLVGCVCVLRHTD